jgi:hypothetical protein
MSRWTAGAVACALANIVACVPSDECVDVTACSDAAWPRWLSEIAIDPDGADDPWGMGLAYDVAHPLWTGAGSKRRALRLPDDASIDVSVPESWQLPPGTIAMKTIADADHPLETRLIRTDGDDTQYEVYAWTDDGSDAERLELDAPTMLAGGHEVPSRLQCRQCHESASSVLLGIDALQLGDAGMLDELTARGVLSDAITGPRPTAAHAEPNAARVLGWLAGNCVHCHNGGAAENASFDLRPDVAFANLVDRPTASSASATGMRVVRGDPDASVLYVAVAGADAGVDAMPPVGARLPDAALDDLRAWIEGLPQ